MHLDGRGEGGAYVHLDGRGEGGAYVHLDGRGEGGAYVHLDGRGEGCGEQASGRWEGQREGDRLLWHVAPRGSKWWQVMACDST